MRLWIACFILCLSSLTQAAEAGGRAPMRSERGVASKEEVAKEKVPHCRNGEERQQDGTCAKIERQRPYRPDRM